MPIVTARVRRTAEAVALFAVVAFSCPPVLAQGDGNERIEEVVVKGQYLSIDKLDAVKTHTDHRHPPEPVDPHRRADPRPGVPQLR